MMDAKIDVIIKNYFTNEKYRVTPMQNGANNLSYKVQIDGNKYILRLYGNHNEIKKLKYEHEILVQLKSHQLSFQIPAPLKTINNQTYVEYQGIVAALFLFIEGEESNRESINYREFGEKIGELTNALQSVETNIIAAYAPTYQLYEVHPKVTREALDSVLLSLAEPLMTEGFLVELKNLEVELNHLIKILPIQIIHGDLMLSNVLQDTGKISGILDFEFVSPDFRMTEVAISLSQFIRENVNEQTMFENIEQLLKGYCKVIELSQDEIQALPVLIKTRMATLFFHFLGRHLEGLDGLEVVSGQLNRVLFVNQWVNKNSSRLIGLLV